MYDLTTILFTALPLLVAAAVLLGSAEAISTEIQAKRLLARRNRRYNGR